MKFTDNLEFKALLQAKQKDIRKFDVSDVVKLSQHAKTTEETKILNLLKKMKPDELVLSRKMLELLIKRGANA